MNAWTLAINNLQTRTPTPRTACANSNCGAYFVPTTQSQKYCCTECAESAKRYIRELRTEQLKKARAAKIEPVRIATVKSPYRKGVKPTRPCVCCGVELDSSLPEKIKYCGTKCRNQHNHDLRMQRKRAAAQARRVDRKCGQCGKPISPEIHGQIRYCTTQCSNKAKHLRAKAKGWK